MPRKTEAMFLYINQTAFSDRHIYCVQGDYNCPDIKYDETMFQNVSMNYIFFIKDYKFNKKSAPTWCAFVNK